MSRRALRVLLVVSLGVVAHAATAATFTVTGTGDAGAGTMRQAIFDANASAGPDTIIFAIAGAGPHTITPLTSLPSITETLLIDGYSQPGAVTNTGAMNQAINALIQIELTGAGTFIGGALGALQFFSSGCVVRGLAINRWAIPGVYLGGAGTHTVEGCFIGTNVAGSGSISNPTGIRVRSDNNTIGGTQTWKRNLISGNAGPGIAIEADTTLVFGNFIGTDVSGTVAVGNRDAGVHINGGVANNIGGVTLPSRNLISGNLVGTGGGGDGVWIAGGSDNDVRGNWIGIDVTGLVALPNTGNGVAVDNSSTNWVGTTTASGRNIISGNDGSGVLVTNGSTGTIVAGNWVGTNGNGNLPLGNQLPGVSVVASNNNQIGGPAATYRNVISGNFGDGIKVSAGALFTTITRNYIGTDTTGVFGLSNWQHGVHIENGVATLVGDVAGGGNVIAYSGLDGVSVVSNTDNNIRGNSIHANNGLGIDLGNDGVTPNDPGDSDFGPNGLQNFPVMSKVVVGWTQTRLVGVLRSAPSTTYRVDFYQNATCDPSANGEGKVWIATTAVTTNPSGDANFDECLPVLVPVGSYVTATATSALGSTSEFSPCEQVSNGFVVLNTNATGPGSLVDAIANGAACPGYDLITFDIPGPGPHTIAPTVPLEIGAQDVIDGYSQPGAQENTNPPSLGTNASLEIEIDLTSSQLVLAEGDSEILGLVLNRCSDAAVLIQSGGNSIRGCFIGTNPDGNATSPNNVGIRTEFFGNNVIGGARMVYDNPIAGKNVYGVHLQTDGNIVRNNLFGVDVDGGGAIGSGNGIFLNDAANNLIGGEQPGQGNVISGGHIVGLYISGNSTATVAQGNLIGTNVGGSLALGNGTGVIIDSASTQSMIGGTESGMGNVISGNGIGLQIGGATTTGNLVLGNFIGVDAARQALPNTNHGIRILGANGNTIGGTIRGAANVIANNGGTGVVLDPTGGPVDNSILGNSIFDNAGLGIDWSLDGVTPNGGPDTFLDFPELGAVTATLTSTIIEAGVSAGPFEEVTVQFFDNVACDPSDHGEGWRWLGDSLVTTDGLGNARFEAILPAAVCGSWISATATSLKETSEFSACLRAVNTPAGTNVVVQPRYTSCFSPATLTFDDVQVGGYTQPAPPDSCPTFPIGYYPDASAACLGLESSAVFTDSVEICMDYDENALAGPEAGISMLFLDTQSDPAEWIEITSSADTTNNTVCGRSDRLGTIVVAVRQLWTSGSPTVPELQSALHQNIPNPFNPVTNIPYDVADDGTRVRIGIYDAAGRLVRKLLDRRESAGSRRIIWDGRDVRGTRTAAGVYFVRMSAGQYKHTRKIVLLK